MGVVRALVGNDLGRIIDWASTMQFVQDRSTFFMRLSQHTDFVFHIRVAISRRDVPDAQLSRFESKRTLQQVGVGAYSKTHM